jgi:hypothetical protein
MKKLVVVILAVAALTQMALAAEFTGTFAAAKARSSEISKPILVDFFTEW